MVSNPSSSFSAPALNKLQFNVLHNVKEIECEVVSVYPMHSHAAVCIHFLLSVHAGNKDPETDLKYVIPMRLFGDGAEAHSNLKNETPKRNISLVSHNMSSVLVMEF